MVTVCLQRIEGVNAKLNAVVHLTAEKAIAQAKEADAALAQGTLYGPLHGVPMTLKDSLDTAGVLTTWGSAALAERVPAQDATVVARLKRAGAILLGKTNTPELTLSFDVNNEVYGRTHNPYNLERMPGGSSGGAVAIIASGGSPFDIGTDTGGSIRLPAHFSGVAGIKPTTGRVPRTGHAIPFGGLTDNVTQVGPLARTVDDLAYILKIIAGPDGRDFTIAPVPLGNHHEVELSGLRCAYFVDNGIHRPIPEIAQAVHDAAETLRAAGVTVEEVRPPAVPETFDLFLAMMRKDYNAPWLKILLEREGADPQKTKFMSHGDVPSIMELSAVVDRWDQFRSDMLTFMDDYDILLSPVNANAALPPAEFDANLSGFSYTMMHNLTGWPAAVVRASSSEDGLPIGVQLAAKPWREDVALAAAKVIEEATGGWQMPVL